MNEFSLEIICLFSENVIEIRYSYKGYLTQD